MADQPIIAQNKNEQSGSTPTMPQRPSPEKPQTNPTLEQLTVPPRPTITPWGKVVSPETTLKELTLALNRSHLAPETINDRVYALIERLGKDIPFFSQLHKRATEQGYKFAVLDDSAPKAVRDFFATSDAISATEKASNIVYFNLEKLESLNAKHGDKINFGRAYLEQLANEGVHIIEDSLNTEEDIKRRQDTLSPRRQKFEIITMLAGADKPTPSEQVFQQDTIEDLTSTIVGNMIGLATDNDIASALKPQKLPNETISEEYLLKRMLGATDDHLAESFPILGSLDEEGKKLIISRAMTFFLADGLEKGVEAKLKSYKILPAEARILLDKPAIIKRMQQQEAPE